MYKEKTLEEEGEKIMREAILSRRGDPPNLLNKLNTFKPKRPFLYQAGDTKLEF